MHSEAESQTAPFDTRFFPQHVTLLTVGENMMPMGYWTVISKDPFRFLTRKTLRRWGSNGGIEDEVF